MLGWGTGDFLAVCHARRVMGSGTVCWFQAVPVFSWSGRGVEPHWPHVQWLSCNPPRTEGETGPRCPTRQDLIQADMVLDGGGWQGEFTVQPVSCCHKFPTGCGGLATGGYGEVTSG